MGICHMFTFFKPPVIYVFEFDGLHPYQMDHIIIFRMPVRSHRNQGISYSCLDYFKDSNSIHVSIG